jgi:hypothetical protein
VGEPDEVAEDPLDGRPFAAGNRSSAALWTSAVMMRAASYCSDLRNKRYRR